MSKQHTEAHQPVTSRGWSKERHTRDAVHLFDGLGRLVAVVYRVGRIHEPGGSSPDEVADVILEALGGGERASHAPPPAKPKSSAPPRSRRAAAAAATQRPGDPEDDE